MTDRPRSSLGNKLAELGLYGVMGAVALGSTFLFAAIGVLIANQLGVDCPVDFGSSERQITPEPNVLDPTPEPITYDFGDSIQEGCDQNTQGAVGEVIGGLIGAGVGALAGLGAAKLKLNL